MTPRRGGGRERGVPAPAGAWVLAGEILAPADTAGLDASKVVALVTEKGGPTSHTAIIARQLGIPCVVGVAGARELSAGTRGGGGGAAGGMTVERDGEEGGRRVRQAGGARG